jgi:hypothetical protein
MFEVDAVPAQSQDLAHSKAASQRHCVKRFKSVAHSRVEQNPRLVGRKRLDSKTLAPRRLDQFRDIAGD